MFTRRTGAWRRVLDIEMTGFRLMTITHIVEPLLSLEDRMVYVDARVFDRVMEIFSRGAGTGADVVP